MLFYCNVREKLSNYLIYITQFFYKIKLLFLLGNFTIRKKSIQNGRSLLFININKKLFRKSFTHIENSQ